MPIYLFSCPECEIELEELRPAWRANEPLDCPVCHGLCVREPSRFSVRSTAPPEPIYAAPQQVARALHGPDCSCCRPRRR
ncbi:MAG: zinc ribbon domain-containing protein [Candidatus Viridilinea halotolerans]|uniref:Zinc ribbon domain-containing protein n=1 Tax=Candidatus Viridilinea halotolerans TaxID=2491704 RepID=A0A426TY27_9CHLR|nr:MAG: zinc ribbon domain-containing protein [Candidatus Viridilinea halotolerans]